MRSMWKGSVSFGLVNVPVSLYTATRGHDVSFHQLHEKDGGRIRYKRVCELDGEEVAYGDIVKGIEVNGDTVMLTDDDLDQLPLSSSKEIEITEFVESSEIDPLLFDKSYYVEPDARALKPYVLLREALERTDQVAIVTVALRQRESMALLRVRDKTIVLQTMLWADEVREAAFDVLDADVSLKPNEIKMADSLVDSLSATFDPSQYEDGYAKAVEELVEAKVKGGDVMARADSDDEENGGGEVIDLMAALRKSIDGTKGKKSDKSGPDKVTKKAPAKKAPAKKASAKKAPAKKAAARKSTGKKKSTGATKKSGTATKAAS